MANEIGDATRIAYLAIRANDKELNYWTKVTREIKTEFPDEAETKLAGVLKQEFLEVYPRISNPVFAELLASAFDRVNWVGVANRLLIVHSVACIEQTIF